MGLIAISCNILKSVLHHAYDETDLRPLVNRSHSAQDARNGPRIGRSEGLRQVEQAGVRSRLVQFL